MRPANNSCWMLFGFFLLWSGGVHLVLHLFFLLREVCKFLNHLFLLDGGATFFRTSDLCTLCGADIDFPAGETRGEAHILAAATDGERLLVFGDLHDRAVLVLEQFDTKYLCRLEGLLHILAVIFRPLDNVYFFTAELGGDDRDAHAALAHQCANRVHVLVARFDGYLRAAAGFAHDAFHFDNAACHFRHFCLEQFCEKARVRARETDEGASYAFVDAQKKRAHALALAIALARYLFVVGQYGGRASEVDEKVSALETLDVTGHYLALPFSVFGDDGSAFRFAHFLHDDLLGGLCRDTPEIFARLERERYLFVELRIFFDASRVFEHDVLFRVEAGAVVVVIHGLLALHTHERCIDDDLCLAEFHVAGLRIERGPDYLPALSILAAVCGGERRGERFCHA